jgi:cation transport ATPase
VHVSVLDRIFWLRSGLATLVGLGVDYVFGTDWFSGLLFAAVVFLGSAYIVRWVWGGSLKPEQANKIYTTAVGTYIMIVLFVWILCFTVGLHSLNL